GPQLHASRPLSRVLHAGGRRGSHAGPRGGAREGGRHRGDRVLLRQRVGVAGRDHRRRQGVRLRSKEMSRRGEFPYFLEIQTRWADNDVYGHVNNVYYYAYFDSIINRYLIEEGGLEIHASHAIGVCVESQCTYKQSISFPETVHAGLRVSRLGNTSVTYEI